MKNDDMEAIETNNQLYLDHYNAAKIIILNLPDNLKITYKKYIDGTECYDYLYKNYIEPNKTSITEVNMIDKSTTDSSLVEIISFATFVAMQESFERSMSALSRQRSAYKTKWLNPISDELHKPADIKPRNPRTLTQYAESKHIESQYDRSVLKPKSIKEIMLETYQEKIMPWKENTSAPITDFFFANSKTSKVLANGFWQDITLESLKIIDKMFNRNITGYSTKVPNEIANNPIFNYRKGNEKAVAAKMDDINTVDYTNDIMSNITSGGAFITEFEYPLNKSSKVSIKVGRHTSVVSEEEDGFQIRALDTVDKDILTQLFSHMSFAVIKYGVSDWINEHRLCQSIYHPDPRSVHIKDLEQRLETLRSCTVIARTINTETNEEISKQIFGFVDGINFVKQGKSRLLNFKPSDQWKQAYLAQKFTAILPELYSKINSSTTRTIMMILQDVRLKEYQENSPSSEVVVEIPISHFSTKIRMERTKQSQFVNDLKKHLQILKDNQIVIQEFLINKRAAFIKITFLPLSNAEIAAYNLQTPVELLEES